MLSTKSSTSAPSESRKYSAMVRPVSAIRARAPGGSLIWPKTSVVLSSTSASCISWYMSLPSRVRSPTPANTDRPWCWWAMLRINSWTITVLPTPAPPKRPIFEPLTKVQIRSMTLMPVSRISTCVCCSSIAGAGRWIGSISPPEGAGSSSMASPITLNIRPKVSTPTGTWIGSPVASTGSPRRNPSVEAMAMQRTVLPPTSCCTSRTTFLGGFSRVVTTIASSRFGSRPGGNSTSTTAPITWLTLPIVSSDVVSFATSPMGFSWLRACTGSFLQGRRPGDDLHQLGGDRRLADLVGRQAEFLDDVAGRGGGVLHRDHLGRVEAGLVLQHSLVDLRLHVPGQQLVEHLLRARLVDVVGGLGRALLALRDRDGQQRAHDRLLPQRADVAGERKEHGVDPLLLVLLEGRADRGQDGGFARPVLEAAGVGDDVAPVSSQEIATLPPDGHVARLPAVVLVHVPVDGPKRIGVERAAEAAIGGDHDEQRPVALPLLEVRVAVLGRALRCRLQDLQHLLRIRSRRPHRLLRAPHAGRGDHLHGLRDLLDVQV